MLCDGGGLYLQATEFGSKTWIFRYRSPITGKLRDMGLGSILSVGLADARSKAAELRSVVLSGLDPISVRDAEKFQKSIQAVAQNNPCNCKGYAGPGGPCYSGPGGIGNACPSVCR